MTTTQLMILVLYATIAPHFSKRFAVLAGMAFAMMIPVLLLAEQL